jgi:hypothetical protein
LKAFNIAWLNSPHKSHNFCMAIWKLSWEPGGSKHMPKSSIEEADGSLKMWHLKMHWRRSAACKIELYYLLLLYSNVDFSSWMICTLITQYEMCRIFSLKVRKGVCMIHLLRSFSLWQKCEEYCYHRQLNLIFCRWIGIGSVKMIQNLHRFTHKVPS